MLQMLLIAVGLFLAWPVASYLISDTSPGPGLVVFFVGAVMVVLGILISPPSIAQRADNARATIAAATEAAGVGDMERRAATAAAAAGEVGR